MSTLLARINKTDLLTITAKMYLLYLLLFYKSISHHYFVLIIALLITYLLVDAKAVYKKGVWTGIALLIMPILIIDYYIVANHAFLLFYIALLFLVAATQPNRRNPILRINAKWILALIMSFSIIHKLRSEAFMQGESLSFLNNMGGLFPFLKSFFPSQTKIIAHNKSLFLEQRAEVDSLLTSTEMIPPEWVFSFHPLFIVGLILTTEIVFVGMLFVKRQAVRNLYFLVFSISLIFFRQEAGFASLLCVLFLMQAGNDKPIYKLAYVFLFACYMALILSGLGVS